MKTSITHKEYLASQLKEDNYSISAKFAAQILSLYPEFTFIFLNILITSLCNP